MSETTSIGDGSLRIRAAGASAAAGAALMTWVVLSRATMGFTTPGAPNSGVLFDVDAAVFYVGSGLFVLSIALLLIGALGLWTHQGGVDDRLWQAGIALTAAGFVLSLLSAAAQVVLGATGSGAVGTVGLGFAVGVLTFYAATLPLGAGLARRPIADVLRLAGLAFLSAGPSLSLAAMLYDINSLVGGLLLTGPYAGAWLLVGYHLATDRPTRSRADTPREA